ncbi:MAG: NAD-dependent epimerase/dehydratase family protein, partial [Promethearchaeota archaeon]
MEIIGVVGGSGFVGGSITKYLVRNFEIRILDIVPPCFQLEGNFSFHKCDIRNYREVEVALQGVDLVIHTAIIQIPKINEAKRLGYEVNVVGTENVCRAVDTLPNVKGLILTGSWHTIGERELSGVIDETFGFRPDKVEDRARLYALSKIVQEAVVRYYDEMSSKIYGIIRM